MATSPTPPSSSASPQAVTCCRRRAQGGPAGPQALTLARQIGDPALIASGLLAVGMTVAETEPEQARACLRASQHGARLSSALDLAWAAGIAFLVNDRTATFELGRQAIHALQRGGDRIRMGFLLDTIAGALAATQPEAAAIIQGAAEAYVAESPTIARLISLIVTEALGEERARELRARGADMDWDQAVAYTLPDHPSPQRAQIRDSAVSKSPRVDTCQERPFGSTPSSCRRVPAPIGLSLAALDRRLGQIKCRLLLCSSADSATATRRRGRIDRHRC